MKMKQHRRTISKSTCFILLLFFFGIGHAQDKKPSKQEKELLKKTQLYLNEGNEEIADENFPEAEVNYRKAIAISPSEEIGKYNLGNAYYNEAKNRDAMRRFAQAASISESKKEKHRAFHNLGNTFMNEKKYQEAVEAYKNALRNNPTDDETRYNLALAKDLLEKNPPQGGDGENDNKDQKENEDQNQDQKENQEDGKDKEGDEGEEKEDENKGDEKDENKEGDNEEDKGKPDQPKDQKEGDEKEEKKPQQQPVPGQLSPQQIKNLLEAMNNEEKKVQDKINAQRQKGAKVKSNKDW